jgi:hypothetical protein
MVDGTNAFKSENIRPVQYKNKRGYNHARGIPNQRPHCAGNHSTSVNPGFISIRNVYNKVRIMPIKVEIKIASHASLPAGEPKPNITVVPTCKNTVIVKS